MKIIFAGTTEFGIPTLEILNTKYQIPFIITQPDQPVGRKRFLTPPPIKLWAQKNSIPVLQPEKLSTITSQLSTLNPDLLLVAAYGQIIPKDILDIPKFGSINIHASLLPKYRGPSPIQTALLNDEKMTGVSLFLMDEQVDHGPIITQKMMTIDSDDDYPSLYKKLSIMAADLVAETLPKWFAGEIKPQEQDHTKSSSTKLFTRESSRINWTDQANNIHQKIKALNPEPGTWTMLDGKSIKIFSSEISKENKIELPGKIYKSNNQLLVKCKDHSLLIKRIQPEGKKIMTGIDFLNGIKNLETKIFV